MTKLDYSFFNRHTVDVAIDLLGKKMRLNNQSGIITETEAYRGGDDPASHAYRGPTNRAKIMFGQAGYSYVYLIYGIYNCLNFVTEPEGSAGAVLIRGVKIANVPYPITNGPGKLSRYFSITGELNNIDLTGNKNFYLTDEAIEIQEYLSLPRVGINAAKERLWRFCMTKEDIGLLD